MMANCAPYNPTPTFFLQWPTRWPSIISSLSPYHQLAFLPSDDATSGELAQPCHSTRRHSMAAASSEAARVTGTAPSPPDRPHTRRAGAPSRCPHMCGPAGTRVGLAAVVFATPPVPPPPFPCPLPPPLCPCAHAGRRPRQRTQPRCPPYPPTRLVHGCGLGRAGGVATKGAFISTRTKTES